MLGRLVLDLIVGRLVLDVRESRVGMMCSPLRPHTAVKAIETLLSSAGATGNSSTPLRRLTLFLDDVVGVFERVYGSRIAGVDPFTACGA